jgi:hypothetical protein
MAPKSDTHIVTALEIRETVVLGFRYKIRKGEPETFINQYFPNFDLLEFLSQIDKLLGPFCKKPIAKVIGLNNHKQPEISIQYYSANYDDPSNGLVLSRSFIKYKDELIVVHDYFVLPDSVRGQGIGKKVLDHCLKQYLQMGVEKIKVHAALQDGGLVWAKALFKACIKDEIDVILQEAKSRMVQEQFNIVKRIYDHYYDKYPEGIAFPIVEWSGLPFMQDILRGSSWHGEIDLANSEDLLNFKMYVTR